MKKKAKAAKNDTTASSTQQQTYYLFLHMVSWHTCVFCNPVDFFGLMSSRSMDSSNVVFKGMTGSIRSPGKPMGWGHEGRDAKDDCDSTTFPPKYAYLTLQTCNYKAAFCDPRKFGKSELRTDTAPFETLAPDAWQGSANAIVPHLIDQSTGIKALLLDQKRACAGVGNWVADEVLYQCRMHPDQAYLTAEEATTLVQSLQSILGTAVDCLAQHTPYPADWLFAYRWTKKKAGKDGQGKSITFVKSGGRTTALIASQQKLYKRKRDDANQKNNDNGAKQPAKKRVKKEDNYNQEGSDRKQAKEEGTSKDEKNAKPPSGSGKQSKSKGPSNKQEKVASSQSKTRKGRATSSKATTAIPEEKSRRRSPRFVSP